MTDSNDDYPSSLLRLRELQESFENEYGDTVDRSSLMRRYIASVDDSDDRFLVGDLGSDMDWMNTSRPLTASDLRGRVVVLDFFTFCCINCQHVLPEVKSLEQELPPSSGLLVVGVHSAKFEHEKQLSSVGQALQRLGVTHPVVNDSSNKLWRRLRVHCWPTLVVLGPAGQALLVLVGEGSVKFLRPFCQAVVDYFRPELQFGPLPLDPGSVPPGLLRFPAKVFATGTKLVIADTGHHRVLVTDHDGRVVRVVGAPEPGWRDGALDDARFNSPQGVVWKDPHVVYVADTGNHVIREVDLDQAQVRTIAGTGQQGSDLVGGGQGTQQPLSSPWDICLVGDILFIAMAGSHQLWALSLQDSQLFGKLHLSKGTCVCVAGSGNEENRNNSYPLRASFAQPSGVAFHPPDKVYIADSESSSIRMVSLQSGAVKNVVGGALNPMDLFCFGDADGSALDARLQHPLGVCWSPDKQLLYVADSYNHKIRQVDVQKRLCTTLVGMGAAGDGTGPSFDEAQFHEPGGLSIVGSHLYVADTNNHCIKLVHLDSRLVERVTLSLPDATDSRDGCITKDVSGVVLAPQACLRLVLELPMTLVSGAPHCWRLSFEEKCWLPLSPHSGALGDTDVTAELRLRPESAACLDVRVILETYMCRNGTCAPRLYSFRVPITVDSDGMLCGECCIPKGMYEERMEVLSKN
ncbi:unnamed protein product [Ixodes hexagonus]